MASCNRCGDTTRLYRVSMFNTDTICMECLRIEEKHPKYEEARDEERKSWMERGQRNFPGIGAPDDLIKQSKAAKIRRDHHILLMKAIVTSGDKE